MALNALCVLKFCFYNLNFSRVFEPLGGKNRNENHYFSLICVDIFSDI